MAQLQGNMRTHFVKWCCRMDIWRGRTEQLTWPIHSGRKSCECQTNADRVTVVDSVDLQDDLLKSQGP